MDMAEAYLNTPAPVSDHKAETMRHPSGLGFITPLAQNVVDAISEYVPWRYECDAYQRLFDALPTIRQSR
jgi:hypothetical protein